jgi:NADH dehydrogenase
VNDRLRVDGFDGVFAVGDIAVEEGDRALPQLAPPAIQGGRYVGTQIVAEVRGRVDAEHPYKRFTYRDKGILATIGRSSAVAQLTGLPEVRGFPAWVI